MLIEILPNIIAFVFSLATMIMLAALAFQMRGGYLSKMINYIMAGIFFAVFIHAGIELIGAYTLIGQTALLKIMGALLIIGAIFFVIGSWIGLRALK